MSTQAKARSRKFHAFKRFPSIRPGRRLVCVALALNLLILPAPLTDVVSRITADIEIRAVGASQTVALAWAKIRPHLFVMRIPPLDFAVPIWIPALTQTIQTGPPDPSKVSSIGVTPVKHVSYVGDRVAYHAQARDAIAAVVQGIKFYWQSLNPNIVSVDEAGRATMLAPGLATISCTAGTASGTALVLVRPGNRPVQSDAQWRVDQGSATFTSAPSGAGSASLGPRGTVENSPGLQSWEGHDAETPVPEGRPTTARNVDPAGTPPRPTPDTAPSFLSSLIDNLAPTAHAQSGGGSGSAWTTNPWVIGTPRNGVIEPTRFGVVLPESFNYELSIPVVASMGNRELNIPLALYYNSQIWSMTGPTTMQFDPNQSWPAPGFSLGLGRIDTTLSGDQQTAYYTLVEPNGTRRYLGSGPASVTGAPPPYPTYWTNDGSYVAYVGDAVHGGELYYPSGAKYDINLVNNRLLVTQITSTNGNYIQASLHAHRL